MKSRLALTSWLNQSKSPDFTEPRFPHLLNEEKLNMLFLIHSGVVGIKRENTFEMTLEDVNHFFRHKTLLVFVTISYLPFLILLCPFSCHFLGPCCHLPKFLPGILIEEFSIVLLISSVPKFKHFYSISLGAVESSVIQCKDWFTLWQ